MLYQCFYFSGVIDFLRDDDWCVRSMYVCMVSTYSRVWINRVGLPILLVVSGTGKMIIPLSPCVPENLVSRDGFSRPVPRQPAHLHTQNESGAYLRDFSRVPRRRPFMKPPYALGPVPSLSGHAIAYRWRSLPRVRRRASKSQGKQNISAEPVCSSEHSVQNFIRVVLAYSCRAVFVFIHRQCVNDGKTSTYIGVCASLFVVYCRATALPSLANPTHV